MSIVIPVRKPRIRIKDIINCLAVFTVFTEALSYANIPFFELRVSYLILLTIILLLLPFIRRFVFPMAALLFFIALIIFSLINIIAGNNNIFLLLKQCVGIIISASFFYLLIKYNGNDIKRLFLIYLNISFTVALFGIIQEAAYFMHYKPLYDLKYILPKYYLPDYYTLPYFRVSSIMPEPSAFCVAMMPAFFVSLTSILRKNFNYISFIKCLCIIIAFLLSFSTVGYMGIIITILIIAVNSQSFKNIVKYSIIAILLSAAFCFSIPDIKHRVTNSLAFFTGKCKIEETNLSTYTFMQNFYVAKNVFQNSPIIGHGFGSHELSYDRYFKKPASPDCWQPSLNFKDANSLFLRFISETGILGLLAFIFFLIRFHLLRSKDDTGYLWVINNAILAFFLVRLIRQGNYFSEGFFFFLWLYFFSKKSAKNSKYPHYDEYTH